MTALDSSGQNYLLNALPRDEYAALLPYLELVQMPLGKVLHESGCTLNFAYFPTTCIISKLHIMENGATTEIAMIGNDGIIGVSLLTGGSSMPSRAIVRSAGYAYRLKKEHLMNAFEYSYKHFRNLELHRLLLRYVQTFIIHTAQIAVCNRHHSVDQQLCRWLLLSLDRLASNELSVTQELIGSLLGVCRESITEAAGKLQREGLILCSRGKIKILDRQALEEKSCECYRVIRSESDRLLREPWHIGDTTNTPSPMPDREKYPQTVGLPFKLAV